MAKMFAVMVFVAGIANAQTQVTADTLGKGKMAVFAMTNAMVVKDFTTLSFSAAQVWYGASDRLDVFAGATETTALGQEQTGIAAGVNLNLLKSKVVNVSTFNTISTPINRRHDASTVLLFTSVVVSKNLGSATPYSGYSVTLPVGQCQGKLFTPAGPIHNVPVGIMIPKGKFAFFVEYNFGRAVKTPGFGVAYAF